MIKINADADGKILIDNGGCDKGSIWNPSNCECECDKLCDVGEYLDYKNCKCSSCTLSIVLFVIAFLMIIGITSVYFYYHWYLKIDITRVKFNTNTRTTIL